MKSGFKIVWTNNALNELKETFKYLEFHWTEKEVRKLASEIERTLKLISENPYLFPISVNTNIHRVPVLGLNTIYYLIAHNKTIEIVSFFSNRKNPKSRDLSSF